MNRLLRRTLYAGSAACCGAILWGASQASAAGNEEPVDQVQQVLIGNRTDQGADASILNKQININLPVAVLAPGANGGDVTQSNAASNTASATNTNRTTQTVDQAQDASSAGGGGVDQQQSADVDNETSQSADAGIDNRQVNVSLPVAVLSPKANGGDVTQSNEATNNASAANRNVTDQAVVQDQAADAAASKGHGPAGQAAVSQEQAADVTNATSQEAQAPVTNEQSNEATAAPAPVSHGTDDGCGCHAPTPPPAPAGDVEQSNAATNVAAADNTNRTDQQVGQVQAADSNGGVVTQDQSADVANATDQSAAAAVDNDQSNDATVPTSGDVTQSNEAKNTASAGNVNRTEQAVAQGQAAEATASGKHGDATVVQDQSADVANATDQSATAPIANDQTNTVGDDHGKAKDDGKDKGHGKGKGPHGPAPTSGDVTQSNEAKNTASAVNVNRTEQAVAQGQAAEATGSKGGAAIAQHQSANPTNATHQAASAPVDNDQRNVVKRDGAKAGRSGAVNQSNEATNDAAATNSNTTAQSVAQGQVASAVGDSKDHGPKDHGRKDHGHKGHGPKDHGHEARRVHAGALCPGSLPSLSALLG